VDYSGSTRSSAFIRVGLVLLLWTRWADSLAFYQRPKLALGIVGALFFTSTLLMAIGLFTRLATAVTAGVVVIMYHGYGLSWGKAGWVHHHTMLLAYATALCALLPAGKSYSVDRWLSLRGAKQRGEPRPQEYGSLFA
jgi:uncharacterized membrane protein YphA (DoxX/SURF4 family)